MIAPGWRRVDPMGTLSEMTTEEWSASVVARLDPHHLTTGQSRPPSQVGQSDHPHRSGGTWRSRTVLGERPSHADPLRWYAGGAA